MSRAYDSKYGARASLLYAYMDHWTELIGRTDLQRQIGFHRLYILETGIMMILAPKNGLSLREKKREIEVLSQINALRKGYEVVEKEFFDSNGLSGKLHYYIARKKWKRAFILAFIIKIRNSL